MRNLAFVVVLLVSVQGWSQSTTTTVAPEEVSTKSEATPTTGDATSTVDVKKEQKVEKVIVTGSHIKRIDVEGAGPVQVLNRRDLEKSGYNAVADVLRDTAANNFGSVREDSGSNTAGSASVNLRGLGSSNTLVLLNGQRLPSNAVSGSVDLNLIPMAAVERIEILKDGASALYGSDALGGVVNIITRRDFTGSEISLVNSTPEMVGGRKTEVALVNGVDIGRANVVTVVQYRDNEKIYDRDRSWNNGISPTGSPGAFRDKAPGAKWTPDDDCPADQRMDIGGGNIVCSFRHTDYSTQLPAIQQLSLLSEANIPIGDRFTLKTRVGGSQNKTQWSYAPSPDTFTVPAAVADTLGVPGHTPGTDMDIRYRVVELGTRDAEVETNAVNVLVGGVVDAGNGWEVEVSAGHNRVETDDKGVNGYAVKSALQNLIATGQFNPFNPAGSRGNIESTRYQPLERMTSELSSAEVKASGAITELPSGPLGVAFGSTFTFQKYTDEFDSLSVAGDVFGNAGSSGGGQRDTRAVFTELSAPLTEKLELQLAARYDEYSDFGNTTNPKVGLVYKPSKSWLLRGSVGTGFKAPLMQDLYAATSEGYPTFIDQVACANERALGGATPSCNPQQYLVTSSGNTGLKEERSLSYNAGVIYEPTRSFNIGTDLFFTKMNNVVGIDYEDLTRAEAMGINPADYGVFVTRTDGYIDSIVAPLQNLSSREIFGFDFQTSYRVGKFKLGTEHSHMFFYREEGFPGTGQRNKIGENGLPPWRNVSSITFLPNERHDLVVSGVTTASHMKEVKEQGKLRPYTTFDLNYSYKMKRFGTLSAGVRNLLGTTPPIDDTNVGIPLDVSLYDQIGRQYYTGYKATF